MALTFPLVPGLTLGAWAVLDDGVANTDVPAPVMNQTENGNLVIELELDYPEASYPMQRELFLDFTTEDLSINDPPEWMSNAPENGTWIAMPPNAERVDLSASEVACGSLTAMVGTSCAKAATAGTSRTPRALPPPCIEAQLRKAR